MLRPRPWSRARTLVPSAAVALSNETPFLSGFRDRLLALTDVTFHLEREPRAVVTGSLLIGDKCDLPVVRCQPMIVKQRTPLTRQQVIGTALHLLNEVGLEGLTTRRLAAELEVQSPALYWHFRSKQDLLDGMAEAIIVAAELGPPREGESWQDWLVRRARLSRASYLRYRDGARLVATARHLSPATVSLFDAELTAMVASGFTPVLALRTITALSNYVTGFVLQEQTRGAGDNAAAAFPRGAMTKQDGADAPTTLLNAIQAGGDPLGTEAFDHGVRAIIDGTEAALVREDERSA